LSDARENPVSIRVLEPTDIPDIVRVHITAMSDDVLPSLGKSTLARYYNRALLHHSSSEMSMIGAYKDQALIGFCQVSLQPVSFRRIIKFDTFSCILYLAVARPGIFLNGIIQSLRMIRLDGDTAEIAFIAVMPDFQSCGIGKKLISEAMKICSGWGVRWILTKTANSRLREYYISKLNAKTIKQIRGFGVAYHILKWPSAVGVK